MIKPPKAANPKEEININCKRKKNHGWIYIYQTEKNNFAKTITPTLHDRPTSSVIEKNHYQMNDINDVYV